MWMAGVAAEPRFGAQGVEPDDRNKLGSLTPLGFSGSGIKAERR